jgi:protein tyrosine phosphatase
LLPCVLAQVAEKDRKAAEKFAKTPAGIAAAAEKAAAEVAAAEKAAAEKKAAEEKAAAEKKAAEEKAAAEKKAAEEKAAADRNAAEAKKAATEKATADAAAAATAAKAKAAADKAAADAAEQAARDKENEETAADAAKSAAAALAAAPASLAPPDAGSRPPDAARSPRKSNISRTRSVRRSLHGAPQPKVTGVQVVDQPKGAAAPVAEDEEALGQEVVEDAVDEQVGEMASEDAEATFGYLGEEVQKLRQNIQSLQGVKPPYNVGFTMAYEKIKPVGVGSATTHSYHEVNKLKNRYGNIVAYDHSRVVLPVINDDPQTDYINANWIKGYKQDRGYVATQGPVPNSFISFWRMVWHVKAEVIVMVTHEIEGNKLKCHRYWPDPTSTPSVKKLQYGSIFVTHLNSVPHKNFTVRTFEVFFNGETRQIKQFSYTAWPDHGVPLTSNELLGFRNAINAAKVTKDIPLVVHCSAGVGRTGTYIAVDRAMDQALDMGGDINIDQMVIDMREARNFMVQTVIQYIFIYRCLNDGFTQLLSGEHSKVSAQQMAKQAQAEAQAAMEKAEKAAMEAEAARLEQLAQEEKEIAEASKHLEAEDSPSKPLTGSVTGMISIKERIALLNNAEERWLIAYQESIMGWNDRNQFEAEEYDTSSALTPLQSRIEALRQKGLVFA